MTQTLGGLKAALADRCAALKVLHPELAQALVYTRVCGVVRVRAVSQKGRAIG